MSLSNLCRYERIISNQRHQRKTRHEIYNRRRPNFTDEIIKEDKLEGIIERWNATFDGTINHLVEKLKSNPRWYLNAHMYTKCSTDILNLITLLTRAIFLKSFTNLTGSEMTNLTHMTWDHWAGCKKYNYDKSNDNESNDDESNDNESKSVIKKNNDSKKKTKKISQHGFDSEKIFEGTQCINCKTGNMLLVDDYTPFVDFVCSKCYYIIEYKSRSNPFLPYRIKRNQALFLLFVALLKKYNIDLDIIRTNCMVVATKNRDTYSYIYIPINIILDGFIKNQYTTDQLVDLIRQNEYFIYTLDI